MKHALNCNDYFISLKMILIKLTRVFILFLSDHMLMSRSCHPLVIQAESLESVKPPSSDI